jgi:ubiquinone biosynthesis protein COQ4
MQTLLRDPERTDLVFVIIRSLSGDSFERLFRRTLADATGARILAERRCLLDALSNRERLRALPQGTLGREYARFMDCAELSADGLVEASMAEDPRRDYFLDERAERLSHRLRDMHDLWHVTAGYDRDLLGEDALLAFTYAQTRNRGVAFVSLMGCLNLSRSGHRHAWRTVVQAWRRGRRARLLSAVDWEALLERPLPEVRRDLGLAEPPRYRAVWQHDPTSKDRKVAGLERTNAS